jgi:hypothetical protein
MIKISKDIAISGIGRWPTIFNNKMVGCSWDPITQHWTFPSKKDLQIKEDPEFFFQISPIQFITGKR